MLIPPPSSPHFPTWIDGLRVRARRDPPPGRGALAASLCPEPFKSIFLYWERERERGRETHTRTHAEGERAQELGEEQREKKRKEERNINTNCTHGWNLVRGNFSCLWDFYVRLVGSDIPPE